MLRATGRLAGDVRKLINGPPDPVPVHYNPRNPAESYLLRNHEGTAWLLVAVGILATLLGLGQILVAVMNRTG